ncbi:MAG: methyltransferase domain-containing protein [Dehalococcoidia bacterium]|nr:methyltransferase domain-containing protein [Dehalococcoidia bacterium]
MPSDLEPDIVAAGYDAVYAAMPKSPTLRRIWREHASGTDYPEAFGHISFITLQELRRMAAELRLPTNGSLVDLGCGLGGPALWVAAETGCRLTGIDFSPVAVAQATARADELGLSDRARFIVGTFADTGLASGSADGVMSEDALQYAPDKLASLREAARILRPSGRLVFTAFELDRERAAGLPALGVDPEDDYVPLLEQAGFEVNEYDEMPGWPEPMATTYRAVMAARLALVDEMGDLAVNALSAELSLTLERQPYRRRILAVATRGEDAFTRGLDEQRRQAGTED